MLSQSTNIEVLQERLGFSSAQITLDRYSHILPGMQEAAARTLTLPLTKSIMISVLRAKLNKFVPICAINGISIRSSDALFLGIEMDLCQICAMLTICKVGNI